MSKNGSQDARGRVKAEREFQKQFEWRQKQKAAKAEKEQHGHATKNQTNVGGIRTDWRVDRA